jgi:hypothetical protein
LDGVRRRLYPALASLPRNVIDDYCGELQEAGAVQFAGASIRLVELRIAEEPEVLFVRFASSSLREVLVLNPINEGSISAGLDTAAWNAAVRRAKPAPGPLDSAGVRDYGCVVLGLAYNSVPRGPCEGEPQVLVRLSLTGGEVALQRLDWSVGVSHDWTISSLTLRSQRGP